MVTPKSRECKKKTDLLISYIDEKWKLCTLFYKLVFSSTNSLISTQFSSCFSKKKLAVAIIYVGLVYEKFVD